MGFYSQFGTTLSITTLSITELSMKLSITTLSMTTLSTVALSIIGLIATLGINDAQQNDTQQYNNDFCYADCQYAECCTFYKLSIDKLQLTGQNLGRIFNFRSGHSHSAHLWYYWLKLINLKLKTWPKQLQSSLLLDIITLFSWVSLSCAGNTKRGSITVPLTSCLTGLD